MLAMPAEKPVEKPAEQPPERSAAPRSPSRIKAGVLGVAFGFTGAHHYYLGSSAAGLLTLATACFGVGLVVGMVEGVMLLVMSDEEFEAKYVRRRPESMEFVFQERP